MSAVYHKDDWDKIYNPAFNNVVTYVKANPAKTLEAIATALTLPYEVVYAVCVAAGFVILPNTSGELHWHAQRN